MSRAGQRAGLIDARRVVVKIGTSSLQHERTGELDYLKIERIAMELCDLKARGMEVILVSSGAVGAGRAALHRPKLSDETTAVRQALAAVGQARLVMTYQRAFGEFGETAAQILMTRNTVVDAANRKNAKTTFTELLGMGVIPIVNENDTIATYENEYDRETESVIGDNDTLSAIVATLTDANLLILLSDIDGLYTDDPRVNSDAQMIPYVESVNDVVQMGKASTGSSGGTGGMRSKLTAARIATAMGIDMVIASGTDVRNIHRIIDGEEVGTLFAARREEGFDLPLFVKSLHYD